MPTTKLATTYQTSILSPSAVKGSNVTPGTDPGSVYIEESSDHSGWLPTIGSDLIIPWGAIKYDGTGSNILTAGALGNAHDGINSLRLPSASDGDNYTQNWLDDTDFVITKAEADQTWTLRIWALNPHTSNVRITIWLFGVDKDGAYDPADQAILVDGGSSGINGTTYYKDIWLNNQNTWYQISMTVTLKPGEDWITGITTRIDNDYSGLDKYIYVDSWGLWRKNISLLELNQGVTNEIYLTPPLIENNLIFLAEGADKTCFNDSIIPDVAVDLVGGKDLTGASGDPGTGAHTPVPSNFPAYSPTAGGCFDFSGGKGINVEQDLGTHTEITIATWIRHSSPNKQYLCDARNNSGVWYLFNYLGANINVNNKLQFNFESPYSSNNLPLAVWMYIVITSSSSGSGLYINGINYTSNCSSTLSFDEDLGVNFRIGTRYTTGSPFYGKMASLQIYNNVLTTSEINQNFEAQKSRFSDNLWEYN